MKIEDQVCSLELAKKLSTHEIKQDSLFYWHNIDIYPSIISGESTEWAGDRLISAFTVAELGEMLPKIISIKTEDEEKKIFSNFRLVAGRSIIIDQENPVEIWSVNYICDSTNEFRNWLFDPLLTKPIYDKKEADARAKMLIYLLENGYNCPKLNQKDINDDGSNQPSASL